LIELMKSRESMVRRMTIDECIKMIRDNVETEWDKSTKEIWIQIAEWLEELQAMRKFKESLYSEITEIRLEEHNKAINDFVSKLRDFAYDYYTEDGYVKLDDIYNVQKQMKY